MWWVLGPSIRSVEVRGDDSLAQFLLETGFELTGPADGNPDGSSHCDAVIVEHEALADATELRKLAAGLQPGRLLGVVVAGGDPRPPEPVPRFVRALELIGSGRESASAFKTARLVLRTLRREGLTVEAFATGDRSRKHGLAAGGWLARKRVPVGWIVVGSRGQRPPSAVEVAVAEASHALERPLRIRRTNVLESGKLMLELQDHRGELFHMRIAGGALAAFLRHSLERVAEILAREPSAQLRTRIIEPIAHGTVGFACYALEPHAPGTHPGAMTKELWQESMDFLLALQHLDPRADTESQHVLSRQIERQIAVVSRHVHERHHRTLGTLRTLLEQRVSTLPIGWRHGDFWSENLLEDADRLTAVIDWEWSAPDSLPVFDLFDLIATSDRRQHEKALGRRVIEILWPLARDGGDERLRGYCDAVGMPRDAQTLEALVLAYWLDRVARDLLHQGQASRPLWLAENLHWPLVEIANAFAGANAHRQTAADKRLPTSRREPTDVLVLCYHAVSDTWRADMAIHPQQLRRQIEHLLRHGYRGATFQDAILSPAPGKTVTVTFDDAYASVFDKAFPLLHGLGVPATVFAVTKFPGATEPMSWPGIDHWVETVTDQELMSMTWDQLRELAAHGWEIGSHSHSHPYLTTLDDETLADELRTSLRLCEEHVGMQCVSVAYPYGDVDQRVTEAARGAGYLIGATLPGRFHAASLLHWPRLGMYGGNSEPVFRLKISRSVRSARVWAAQASRDR